VAALRARGDRGVDNQLVSRAKRVFERVRYGRALSNTL
jgi:hypothetical protein